MINRLILCFATTLLLVCVFIDSYVGRSGSIGGYGSLLHFKLFYSTSFLRSLSMHQTQMLCWSNQQWLLESMHLQALIFWWVISIMTDIIPVRTNHAPKGSHAVLSGYRRVRRSSQGVLCSSAECREFLIQSRHFVWETKKCRWPWESIGISIRPMDVTSYILVAK